MKSSGEVIEVERFIWSFSSSEPNSATFAQFPLRPAYAMTIHKSQGISLDAAYLDIRAAREPGQAYVAVSRVRKLAGLHSKYWIKALHVSPEAIRFYQDVTNQPRRHEGWLPMALRAARRRVAGAPEPLGQTSVIL